MNGIGSSTSPYIADVFVDRPIYNPGDTVKGQLILKLNRRLCCDLISAQLYGSARVFFVQKIVKPGAFGQSKAFEQEQILIDETNELWVSKSRGTQSELTLDDIARRASSTAIRFPASSDGIPQSALEIGTHTYNFSFTLPQTGLYTSFDAKNAAGCIRYNIMIKIFNGSALVLRKKLLFAVVCPKVLISHILGEDDGLTIEKKEFDKESYLSVHLRLEKKVFVPGEPVRGNITIENRSGKSVKYANLYIVQDTVCYSTRPEVQVHESTFATAGMGLTEEKVRTGATLTYPIKFNIPALVPNIDIPSCIHMDYRLQLDVGFLRGTNKGVPIRIKVPIAIGTHLKTNEFSNNGFPSAPPAYDEINGSSSRSSPNPFLSDHPPVYTASIGGLSEVNDRDAQDNYTPLCYHYNFGFTVDDEVTTESKKNQ